jgi:hypothetical protein
MISPFFDSVITDMKTENATVHTTTTTKGRKPSLTKYKIIIGVINRIPAIAVVIALEILVTASLDHA